MKADWVLTVGQLNEYVRKQLAADPMLRTVRVRGELSGFKRHYSGHLYFSIKDDKARVQCVMFRQYAQGLSFAPCDGQQVVVTGAASLYAATGSFQLYCEEMAREGAGELFLRFEALKRALSAEGLFDPARKRPLPLLPGRIGIVTSRSGAALRDMLRVARRRDPRVDMLICPAAVQGAQAAGELVRALDMLNQNATAEVILLGRGGGSIEDLWAFNEEAVARAIARSRIPIVSCVGHETDFTIADFAADLRAATPSMAAELTVPVRAELEGALCELAMRMRRALGARLTLDAARLERLAARLGRPGDALIRPRRDRLDTLEHRLDAAYAAQTRAARAKLEALERALRALDPSAVLERGYALLSDASGPLTRVAALRPGKEIGIRMRDGRAVARVLSVGEEKEHGGQEESQL